MALFVRQDENRSQLQQRLATELQERAKQKAKEAELPDGVSDSQFMKGTKQTSKMAWIWIVIAVMAILVIIALTVITLYFSNIRQYGVANHPNLAYNND